ncbi:MAG TPA: invasion associated locus B family protein [Rhizomicrobium sp.]|nr:invasion associated locus B family protein [Rhizomicrobium sp.]
MNRIAFALPFAAAVLAASFAFAAPTPLGTFKNWSAYETGEGDGKVCYALSRPTSTEPSKIRRDPAFILINDWPARHAKAEPEIVPGFQYRDGSNVTAQLGGDTVTLFTKNDGGQGGAWVEAQSDEERLVNAMKTAPEAVVTGTSKRGTVVKDTYSLAGFADALDKIQAVCGP